jgi:hypothetical protein
LLTRAAILHYLHCSRQQPHFEEIKMELTINGYESSPELKAAAKFLLELADLSAVRPVESEPQVFPQETTPSTSPVVEEPAPVAPTPEAPAPAAPEEPAPAPTVGDGELDSSGRPWDSRIHSSGKTKVANGTWKLKKGVDKALVEQVQAESVQEQPAAAAPQDPSVFAAQEQVVEGGPLTWPNVLKRVVPKQIDGTYDKIVEQQFFAEHNLVGELPILATRPDLFEAFLEAVKA